MTKLKGVAIAALMFASSLSVQGVAHAAAISQWATTATATSFYDSTYSADQAAGAPNATGCDNSNQVWATKLKNEEASISLTYATAVVPTQINVYQNNVKGAVSKIEVSADATKWTTVYTGDPTKAVDGSCDASKNYDDILAANVAGKVATGIKHVRITVDQSTKGWAEIDSVQLVGKNEQKIASVANSLKINKTLTLPAKTNKNLSVTWTSSTKSVCTVTAGVLKGIAKGTCKIKGTNAGNAANAPISVDETLSISK